jgi:CheY-like chemotaxis protein
VVSVQDNGIGIPAQLLPTVFDIFTQVDSHRERSQSGLGIGLSIVKRLVEMHGGSVRAASDGPGKGSEFTIRLPIATPSDSSPALEVAPAPPQPGRRVLVVDDNHDAAATMAKVLRLMGNECQTAHDGLAALEVAAQFRPDVILLDIGMPHLDGYDTARRIRQQAWGQGVLLIALTGWGQDHDRQKSHDAGFDQHVVKPIGPAALRQLLASN